jgi:hypothetical protein
MAYADWREAVEALGRHTGPPTPKQLKMGKVAGLAFGPGIPRLVADAQLQWAISKDLSLNRLPRFRGVRGYVTQESQAIRIEGLRKKSEEPKVVPMEAHEAEAWIQHLSLKRRIESIRKLKPNSGDLVELGGRIVEVASIGEDGRVFFRGGRGSGAWPDKLKLKFRKNDASVEATNARKEARNAAAKKMQVEEWSLAKRRELTPYLVTEALSEDDVVQLEDIINSAEDERSIQEFLAQKPHILGSLLGGDERYSIPKQKLGTEYVTDFLLCHADSLGANWTLVELETPRSSVTIKSSNELESMHVRAYRKLPSGESGWRIISPLHGSR